MLEQKVITPTKKQDRNGISIKKAMLKLVATETQATLTQQPLVAEKEVTAAQDEHSVEKPIEIKNSESILTEQFIESITENFIASMTQFNASLETLGNSLENYENERLIPSVDSVTIPKKITFLIEFLKTTAVLSALIKQLRSTFTDIDFKIQTASTSVFGSTRGKKAVIKIFKEMRDNFSKLEAAASSYLLIFKNSNQKAALTNYERSILANAAADRPFCFTELYKFICTNPKLSFKEVAQFLESSKTHKAEEPISSKPLQKPSFLASRKTKSFSTDLNRLTAESKTAKPNHSTASITSSLSKKTSNISILHKKKLEKRSNKQHAKFDFSILEKPQQSPTIKPIAPIALFRSNTSPLVLTSIFTKPDQKKELALLKKNLKHCQNPQKLEEGLNEALEQIEGRLDSIIDSFSPFNKGGIKGGF